MRTRWQVYNLPLCTPRIRQPKRSGVDWAIHLDSAARHQSFAFALYWGGAGSGAGRISGSDCGNFPVGTG